MKLPSLRWSPPTERSARIGLILIGIGLVLFNFVRIVIRPIGDFHYHWQLGYDLLAGHSLYLGPGGAPPEYPNPYPPFWAMFHAPFTVVSAHLAQAVLFLPFYLGSLGLLLFVLQRLSAPHLPLNRRNEFWATALAMIIALQFLARDMAEIGINIALVALAWLAIYLWTKQRDWWAGASLGLAIALKMTAALFVPYFLWKRQWKIAATATLFAVLFSLAPVMVRGPTRFATDLREWVGIVRGIGTGTASAHVLGQESTRNFALRPVLTRWIAGGEPETGRFVLPDRTASLIIYMVEIGLVVAFAAIAGRQVNGRLGLSILYECAAISLLMLLLSPITWGHHCVGMFPGLYLIFRTAFYYRELPGWMLVPLGYLLVSLSFNRGIVGRELSHRLSAYSVVTWEIIAVLVLTLGCRRHLGLRGIRI